VPASEADWAAYLERTKRDVTSALENITQEEAKLEERLKSLRATRVRLQAMQRAFAETPVERTGFFIPDVDPLAAEAHVGEPSPIEEIAPPEPAPASLVPSLPEPEAHSANVALLPEIEGGESRIEKLEAKVDELMSVLKKLSAQVEAAGQAK
jgi:chromosome segregation ATPase